MSTKQKNLNLNQLVRFIESKHVAIPEFQRGFVWKSKQVKDLFDSLIKQYPVGSFILWETNANIDARTLDGEQLPKRNKYLIIDGQQRMTSLYYLCRQNKFVEPHIKDKFHEISDIRAKQVIDFEKFIINKDEKGPFLDYVRESSCKLKVSKFNQLVGNSYKFPVIIVSLKDYHQAIEVFERVNQAGTRISTESIFLSETWNKSSNIGKILRTWKSKNGESLTSGIDTVIFIHVFAIVMQIENNGKESIEIGITMLKKLAGEVRQQKGQKFNNIFKEIVKSVARSIHYLKEEYGIISLRELPSQTMVTVLSVFFYYHKSALTNVQQNELRKWFWRSSLSNRYIGSGYSSNINIDSKKMFNLAQNDQKLDIPKVPSKLFAKVKGVDIRTGRSTYRNIIKLALWKQTPVFINGENVSRNDVESGQHKPEDDHFFPYDFYKKEITGQEINNILNIHFLNGDENSKKKAQWPSKWLTERVNEIGTDDKAIEKYLLSQLLPFKSLKSIKIYERGLKIKNKRERNEKFGKSYQRFLKLRSKLFEKTLERLQNGLPK